MFYSRAGEWEKVKLAKEIQNYLAWANTFNSVLALLKKADLKFSWHENSEFQKSHSKVFLQGLLWILRHCCLFLAFRVLVDSAWRKLPPKASRRYLELTSVLSFQLQIIFTFSEYHSLAHGFLRHEGNENPVQVRRHVSELSWVPVTASSAGSGSAHFTQWNQVEFYSARDEITLQEPDWNSKQVVYINTAWFFTSFFPWMISVPNAYHFFEVP